ncbi:hypothetical protein QBC41DRAFT_299119 [Cercophora samala]|uniref:Uncharacterized protein n=1 Tax=Cercophora samala TaxID=330535 RepID=A0AA39ZKZ1_9PEZI|nr:hypothetical protein QBC41DRAFT_299119 [Cercophora samala]
MASKSTKRARSTSPARPGENQNSISSFVRDSDVHPSTKSPSDHKRRRVGSESTSPPRKTTQEFQPIHEENQLQSNIQQHTTANDRSEMGHQESDLDATNSAFVSEEPQGQKSTSEVENNNEYDHLIGCVCGAVCESRLRSLAVTVMAHQTRDKPNGTSIAPPKFYERTREFSNRPMMWKKDWESGEIRPRRKIDDEKDAKLG